VAWTASAPSFCSWCSASIHETQRKGEAGSVFGGAARLAFRDAVAHHSPDMTDALTQRAETLLAQMRLDEKLHVLSGDLPIGRGLIELALAYGVRPVPAGALPRLGLPGVRFCDGPRGVVVPGSTCFPVSMARGATWDPELEERVGAAMGAETRAHGGNLLAAVCINVLRHPAWGRAQETYGEDPYHLGEMGAALVRGIQRHVMACVKHFAANSMENARFRVDVRIDERALREVYLPHFKRCVDAGAAAVMSAYNKLNGEHCGHNRYLLRDILKREWGFQGFVMSDFVFGIREARAAILAGLDQEMPLRWRFRKLRRLVDSGTVPTAVIDEAVTRIVRQQLRFDAAPAEELPVPGCAAHRALAREVAEKGIVLLKNDPVAGGVAVLPIDRAVVRRIAVIGRLADLVNTGDHGSSKARPVEVIPPLQGIRALAGNEVIVDWVDGRDPAAATAAARAADVTIVVAGYTYRDEGEYVVVFGGDRAALTLRPQDEALIRAVSAVAPRSAVVLIGGSAIVTEGWRDGVPAIVMAWYPGMEGGHALANILFGAVNPSGKLPCVFPRAASQLPFFNRNARSIEYGLFHGYQWLDRNGDTPAFAFGFGLSYTTFAYADLEVTSGPQGPDEVVRLRVAVRNTGTRPGEEVVQCYVGYPESKVERPVKALKAFRRVRLAPGETRHVELEIAVSSLAYWERAQSRWIVEPGAYDVFVGGSSREGDLLRTRFRLAAAVAPGTVPRDG
jgi:beta-glucosidase